ncbi:MAG: hypothetical protein U0165_09160 [Polyangiaceae bacterium]
MIRSTEVFSVSPNGQAKATQLVKLPFESFLPERHRVEQGQLLVAGFEPCADLASGSKQRRGLTVHNPRSGSRSVVVAIDAGQGFPGAVRIQIYGDDLYGGCDRSLEYREDSDGPIGKAGTPSLYANTNVGCDDFAFDFFGNIYCASFFDTVLKINRDGTNEAIITGGTLDGPTSIAFGRTWDDFTDIYVSNASFLGFSAKHAEHRALLTGTFGAGVWILRSRREQVTLRDELNGAFHRFGFPDQERGGPVLNPLMFFALRVPTAELSAWVVSSVSPNVPVSDGHVGLFKKIEWRKNPFIRQRYCHEQGFAQFV